MVRNCAFVFIKPHAVTDKVKELAKETFEKKDISIKKEGELGAEEIDSKKLVDKHYYAIASKATLLTPDKLNVPEGKFKDKFGLEWKEVLKSGTAINAIDCCEKFEVDAARLDTMWGECKKNGNLVKLGGGFYCGKLVNPKDEKEYYVFNGFFMSMRSKFVETGAKIYYYVVEWDSEKLKWEDFRGKVLGPTDPADAPADSLRGACMAKWQDLGLKSVPNTGDNAFHASASPFEALAERANWLGYRPERDPFGKLLLRAGVKRSQIKDWSVDPQVTFGLLPMTKSLFDSLEDTDSDYCLALCQMIGATGNQKDKDKVEELEKEIARLQTQLESYQALETAVKAIQAYTPAAGPKGSKKGDAKAKKGEGKGKGEKDEGKDEGKAKKSKGKGKGKKDKET